MPRDNDHAPRPEPEDSKRWLLSRAANATVEDDYFFLCLAEIRDACTVEDAIYWHTEILNELAVELLGAYALDKDGMADVIAVLHDRQQHHAQCVATLTEIVRTNAQLRWQPDR